jgi:bidirectional [NiFe] hydrogenase diaphorase subunit
MGTACYVKRAAEIVAALQTEYSIEPGQTTPDGKLSILTARCLGSCGLAPVIVLDGEVLAREAPETTIAAVKKSLAGGPRANGHKPSGDGRAEEEVD